MCNKWISWVSDFRLALVFEFEFGVLEESFWDKDWWNRLVGAGWVSRQGWWVPRGPSLNPETDRAKRIVATAVRNKRSLDYWKNILYLDKILDFGGKGDGKSARKIQIIFEYPTTDKIEI